jgi:uncharacterized protein
MAVSLCPMIKIRNIQPRTFEHVKFFPGCAGNPFDWFLHSLEKLEKLPALLLILCLAGLTLLGSLPRSIQWATLPLMAKILPVFFITDWVLISLLPETHSSFGPIKVTVLMLACLRVPFAWLPFPWNLGFEMIGTLLVIYGFYLEPFRVEVHREVLITSKFSKGESLRVLHLGDLHLERTTRRENLIIQKVNELKPDLILFSGDVLNLSYLEDPQSQADAISFFKQLNSPLWVFGVSGSPAVDFPEILSKLAAETPLHWLNNQTVPLKIRAGKINIIGLTCTHNPDQDENTLAAMLDQNPTLQEGFNLLLYHSPDLAPNASRCAIDLQLSGHTHGGQIRLPFVGALFTGCLYGRFFEAGRYLVNNMPLYITRGLGMEGAIAPRVRFLCRPEIILWQIVSE